MTDRSAWSAPCGKTNDPLIAPLSRVPTEPLDFAEVNEQHPALGRFAQRLGQTPLIEAPSVAGGATILAKCEWTNPAGSIKDRAAYAMLANTLRGHDGSAVDELRVLEYSGGQLAVAISQLGGEIGMPVRLVVSSFSKPSLLERLRSNGATVDVVDKETGFLGVIRQAQRIAARDSRWTLLFQHANPINLATHEYTTGEEIARQLDGRVPHTWIASIGTGGTLIGVLRALRRMSPQVRAIGVTPAEAPYGSVDAPSGARKFGGAAGLGLGIRQPFVRAYESWVAQHRHISYESAMDGMRKYFDLTGTRIGGSSAANWLIAKEEAARLPADDVVLTVFADAGSPEQWEELGR